MEKIKQFLQSDRGKDILTVIIIILVGLASFGLGRLSKNGQNAGISVEYIAEQEKGVSGSKPAVLGVSEDLTPKAFFASNRGSKYYSIGCTGGKTIKQENRIYFETKEDAERAGYELSSSCR